MRSILPALAALLFVSACGEAPAEGADRTTASTPAGTLWTGNPKGNSEPDTALASSEIDQTGIRNGGATASSPPAAASALTAADEAAIFRAAGFTRRRGQWMLCDDPGTVGYAPGEIGPLEDVNGDGLPEAVILEGSTFCHGMTGTGYSLLSRQSDGSWKLIDQRTGIPEFLATRSTGGWRDIQVGMPGFCFPVLRWNGREYALHRTEYEGKPCTPDR